VLVVDDDEWLRRALVSLLRANGFEVDSFPCAESFFGALDGSSSASLVILDYQLPKTTGAEIAASLRERFGDDCPPLLLVSGSLDDVSPTERARFDRILAKPFVPGTLLEVIEELIASS
jgi:two-component system response regulator FlrC